MAGPAVARTRHWFRRSDPISSLGIAPHQNLYVAPIVAVLPVTLVRGALDKTLL
jgi:hypothetical protein